MRLLLQRTTGASVTIDDVVTGRIDAGLVVFVGLSQGDTPAMFPAVAEKILNLRIFNDDEGKLNKSLLDAGGGLLVISQFTLYADARKGRRPSYTQAMPPAEAAALFDLFFQHLRSTCPCPVEGGRFGAHMHVDLVNDGPVTIWLDSAGMGWDKKAS